MLSPRSSLRRSAGDGGDLLIPSLAINSSAAPWYLAACRRRNALDISGQRHLPVRSLLRSYQIFC